MIIMIYCRHMVHIVGTVNNIIGALLFEVIRALLLHF